jgi:hypothetical protein
MFRDSERKDPFDGTGFAVENFIPRGFCGRRGNIAVAIGSSREHRDIALLRFVEFPPALPFENLLAFVLRNHALPLQQQRVFGRSGNLAIYEGQGHTEFFEFLHQQHLMGVFSG